jgi:hypothetical protein
MNKSFRVYTIINCKDCVGYHKILDEICLEYNMEKVLIDVDKPQNLEQNLLEMIEYKVKAIPHTLLCLDGKPITGKPGILTKEEVLELINYVN